MKRYFTNTKSGANKFWSIEIKSNTYYIRYGRVDSAGKEVIKAFDTKSQAQAEADKRIKEKIAKGYKEIKDQPVKFQKVSSAFAPMNKKMFWTLIDSSLIQTSLKKQALYIQKELKRLPKKDLVEFENIFVKLENVCYSWNLWAAAYTIHRGCSDDGFTDFRAWLVTRGQGIYEKAIKSSDSLSALGEKVLAKSNQGDYFLYLSGNIYEERFGSSIEEDIHIKSIKIKTTPSGKEWKDVQMLKKMNPTLFTLIIGK